MLSSADVRRSREFSRYFQAFTPGICLVVLLAAVAPASAQVGSPSSCTPDEALLQNYVTAHNDAAAQGGFFGKTITMEQARQYFTQGLAQSQYQQIKELRAFIDRDAEYISRYQGSTDPLRRNGVAETLVRNKLLECRIAELQAPAQSPAGARAGAPSDPKAGASGSGATTATGGSVPAEDGRAARQVTIAGSGRSAMHCVRLVRVAEGSSGISGSNRVLSNGCEGPVEVTWCVGAECAQNRGGMWTIQPGRSWPIPGTGEVRWAACHGVNTVHFRKGSQGTRFYCTEPAKPQN